MLNDIRNVRRNPMTALDAEIGFSTGRKVLCRMYRMYQLYTIVPIYNFTDFSQSVTRG